MVHHEQQATDAERRPQLNASKFIRWGVWGALLAALGWTVSSIVAFVLGGDPFGPIGSLSWTLIETFDAIGEIGMLVALIGLHVRQAPTYGRLGTAGFAVTAIGVASLFLATVIWLLSSGADGLVLGVFFIAGIVGWVVGFPILGIATWRGGVLPQWVGLSLIAYAALFLFVWGVLLDSYGEARLLIGLPWLAFAYVLWSQRDVSVEQSSVEPKEN